MLSRPTDEWIRVPISRIEDLSDAVFGAGLEATQMTRGRVSGSLAFAQKDGILYGSGLIRGTVALAGPLSLEKVTFGFGLDVAPGTWHWMKEVRTGSVGLFHPCDEHDSHYTPGTLYATLSIDAERLEEAAAREDLVLNRRALGGTGFHSGLLHPAVIARLRQSIERVHAGCPSAADAGVGDVMLAAVINHYSRLPVSGAAGRSPSAYAAIVRRARSYVVEHLTESVCLANIARAAYTSQRTLHRAFAEILNDTPQGYVRRLRLHRIRHDLASDAERVCTIALVSNRWGMAELGRMSGWYRELFGERPSDTRVHAPDGSHKPVKHPAVEIGLAGNA
jgi:AraC-like DNA-binding protein